MFSLARYALRKVFLSSKSAVILIIGLDGSGKTCLLNDFKRKFNQDQIAIVPTNGLNSCTFKFKGVKYDVRDVGGGEYARKYWSKYYNDADIVVYLVDVSDEERLELSKQEFLSKVIDSRELQGAAICVCANKMDKAQTRIKNKKDLSDFFEIDRVCANRASIVLATVTGSKIEEEFHIYKQNQRKKGIRKMTLEETKYDEETIAKFPLHQHYGCDEILAFAEECLKNDKTLATRRRKTVKRK